MLIIQQHGGNVGGRGSLWGDRGGWASANGNNAPPGNAGVALLGNNITVENINGGVVKGS